MLHLFELGFLQNSAAVSRGKTHLSGPPPDAAMPGRVAAVAHRRAFDAAREVPEVGLGQHLGVLGPAEHLAHEARVDVAHEAVRVGRRAVSRAHADPVAGKGPRGDAAAARRAGVVARHGDVRQRPRGAGGAVAAAAAAARVSDVFAVASEAVDGVEDGGGEEFRIGICVQGPVYAEVMLEDQWFFCPFPNRGYIKSYSSTCVKFLSNSSTYHGNSGFGGLDLRYATRVLAGHLQLLLIQPKEIAVPWQE